MTTPPVPSSPDGATPRRTVRRLPADLVELLRIEELEVAGLEEIGPVSGAPYGKRSFLLRLSDGGKLKGRTCVSEGRATRYSRLAGRLDLRHFPRLLRRHGSALLEEWVEGRRLDREEWTPERLRECGEILGRLHAGEPHRRTPRYRRPELELARLERRIGGLVSRGALEPSDGTRLSTAAGEALPAHIAWGVVHGDFCANNIVIRPPGELAIVDNETVDLGALDGDLARTWCRWPMDETARRAFAEGFERHRPLDGFRASRPFWLIRALAASALFWLDVDSEFADPLDELRRLANSGAPAGISEE